MYVQKGLITKAWSHHDYKKFRERALTFNVKNILVDKKSNVYK